MENARYRDVEQCALSSYQEIKIFELGLFIALIVSEINFSLRTGGLWGFLPRFFVM